MDRQAWGSDRHMPSTQETMFKNTHIAEFPRTSCGKFIATNTTKEFKLGLWLSKKGEETINL